MKFIVRFYTVKNFLLIREKSFVLSSFLIILKVRWTKQYVGYNMKSLAIRLSAKPYIDRQKFPYGFRKSGDFSITEADLLTNYGKTLLGLESGELLPESEDEKHFVEFINGKVEAANNLEKAWAKYVRLARGKKHFYTLHSSASNQSDYDDDFSDDEFDVA